jgi:hypothetical protein
LTAAFPCSAVAAAVSELRRVGDWEIGVDESPPSTGRAEDCESISDVERSSEGPASALLERSAAAPVGRCDRTPTALRRYRSSRASRRGLADFIEGVERPGRPFMRISSSELAIRVLTEGFVGNIDALV